MAVPAGAGVGAWLPGSDDDKGPPRGRRRRHRAERRPVGRRSRPPRR
ncbi:hypothetical protein ACU686_05705 [Yinghuangia aomiensis]